MGCRTRFIAVFATLMSMQGHILPSILGQLLLFRPNQRVHNLELSHVHEMESYMSFVPVV